MLRPTRLILSTESCHRRRPCSIRASSSTTDETGLSRKTPGRGRLSYEYLEGAVLALVELKRWDAAVRAVERYCTQYPHECHSHDLYLYFIHWMSGARPQRVSDDRGTDLYRYWALEFRLANGEDPHTLLPLARAEVKRKGSAAALVRSPRPSFST